MKENEINNSILKNTSLINPPNRNSSNTKVRSSTQQRNESNTIE